MSKYVDYVKYTTSTIRQERNMLEVKVSTGENNILLSTLFISILHFLLFIFFIRNNIRIYIYIALQAIQFNNLYLVYVTLHFFKNVFYFFYFCFNFVSRMSMITATKQFNNSLATKCVPDLMHERK